MKNKKEFIIFGSNFGSNTHLDAIKKICKKNVISICSPNIKNKKKFLKYKRFKDYNSALKKEYDFISIATPPKIQKEICKKILKKENSSLYVLLEKPITENFIETQKIIKRFQKKKINFLVNFIFVNIFEFIRLKNFIRKKKISFVKYKWLFKQKYFENKKKTWKTNHKIGGGIINYYLIHVFYNLLFYFNKLKIVDVEFKKTNSLITCLKLNFIADSKIKIQIEIDINSVINEHSLLFKTQNEKFNLINSSKDWVNNFNIYINNKKINDVKNYTNRTKLTLVNYKKLILRKFSKKETENKTLIAHKLCDVVSKKVNL